MANLNGLYQGNATGERFRKRGKTDLCIEDENRAAFVAECKVWRGPNEVPGAVDQLLSYLTWRDCKAALLVFNKTVAGFTSVQAQFPEVLQRHPNCETKLSCVESGEWRFRFQSAEDPDRKVTIHAFLFNLHTNEVPVKKRPARKQVQAGHGGACGFIRQGVCYTGFVNLLGSAGGERIANIHEVATFLWGIADEILRDDFKRGKYPDVILPFVVLRRLDCVLAPTREQVLQRHVDLQAKGMSVVDGQVGRVSYEINFNRYFYRYQPPRPLAEIDADIRRLEAEIAEMLREVSS